MEVICGLLNRTITLSDLPGHSVYCKRFQIQLLIELWSNWPSLIVNYSQTFVISVNEDIVAENWAKNLSGKY